MSDSIDSSPASPPPLEPNRHSRLGVASFILSIISMFLVGLIFVFFYWMNNSNSSNPTDGILVIILVLILGIGLFTLVGIGLGIAGVVKPARGKVFGILGIVFNTLILSSFCTLVALAALVFWFLIQPQYMG